jgi:diguanylate cyclase (GGDEF)-like protein
MDHHATGEHGRADTQRRWIRGRWSRLAARQTMADADQTAADADQAAADADQGAAELEQAYADQDQRTSDRDQATADRERAAQAPGDEALDEAYHRSRTEREAGMFGRLAAVAARGRARHERLRTAAERDERAAHRDEAARRRDGHAARLEAAIAASDPQLARRLEVLRVRAAADRERAAADRARAAEDRAAAGREIDELKSALTAAHLDDLTGAYRREAGALALSHEIMRARRIDGRMVVAFIDVDGLKDVNDREGHAAGDGVLRRLVATLRRRLRSYDPVVRYGGDEFVCGLGGTDLADVEARFGAMRDSLSAHGIHISVGLAALEPGESRDHLVARADAALLRAKATRREGRSPSEPAAP